MHLKSLGFALAIALGSGTAQAQGEKTLSLTISPFHLALPVLELTGEYALSQDFGLAAIGGFGKITQKNSLDKNVAIPVLELGGQLDYYAVGSFRHGMQVGAEFLWIKVSPPKDQGVTLAGNGLALGPLLGYKWAARFGLTFMVQGGYEFLFAQSKATDASGRELEASTDSGLILFNANAGWSF
jgi:hypothetical protein